MRTEVHSEIYYGYKQRKRSFTGLLLGGPHIRPVRPGQAHPRSSAVQRKPCTTPAQRVSCSRQLIHVSSLHFTSLWTQNCEFPLNTNQTKTEGWRVTSLPPALFLWWGDLFVFCPKQTVRVHCLHSLLVSFEPLLNMLFSTRINWLSSDCYSSKNLTYPVRL